MGARTDIGHTNGIRGLIPAALMSLVALAVLLGLGFWQVERLAWKEGLIAAIEARVGQTPVPLEQPAEAWKGFLDQEYLPVTVKGRFRHEDERRLFASDDGTPGWHIYTPLETEGGRILFVNRGFVPDELKEPGNRGEGQIAGPVTVTGLLRKPGVHGWFEPDADTARNVWYWRDLGGMTASLASEADRVRVLPFFVDARVEPANPGGWPKGGTTILTLTNRHLEYALTWFGLAATLVAVFAAFAWSRLRATAND